jgi:hypothetical protein
MSRLKKICRNAEWLRSGMMLIVVLAMSLALIDAPVYAEDLVSTPPRRPVPSEAKGRVPGAVATTKLGADRASVSGPVAASLVSIGLNFQGSQLNIDSGFIPPDTMGAVGPDHIAELINGRFDAYTKTTGTQVFTASLDGFWTNVVGVNIPDFNDVCVSSACTVSGKACATNNDCDINFTFDPRIVYDLASNRWFASSIDSTNPATGSNNIYLARSDTDDPTGTWQGVRFLADSLGAAEFHDYDTLALDDDGLYICTNDFGQGKNNSCYSIPKADLLLAPPSIANMTRFEGSPPGLPVVDGSPQVALNFGPSNGVAPVLGARNGALQRSNIFGSAGPAPPFLGAVTGVTGDPGHAAAPAARQPLPGPTIENVTPRFVANVFRQDDSLWAVHAVRGTGNNSAIRWYEISEATNTVLQTGLIENLNQDFHEPSIAVNEFGHVVAGYTCSGPLLSPSACVSVGQTTGGVTLFEAPKVLAQGSGCYYQDYGTGRNRWGDYSATVIDPVSSCTFWTFQEFLPQGANCQTVNASNPGGAWGVQITQLTFTPPVITLPGALDFGDTCVGSSGTATLNVCNTTPNTGPCANLVIESIASSDPQFQVATPTSGYPVVVGPDSCFPFQVGFAPASTNSQTSTLTITSNDPANPAITVQATGKASNPAVRITGSSDFGALCAGTVAEKKISVCNVGKCDLEVTSAAFNPACSDFQLINNPFPAAVSHDSCNDLVIRFTPTSPGPKSCNLVIDTSDPVTPTKIVTVTGNISSSSIDIGPDQTFAPTVIQSVGTCSSEQIFEISNTGGCNLTITNIALNGTDYALAGLTSFPIILEPGHQVGNGFLRTLFKPLTVARALTGTLAVTYVSDPATNATTTVTRNLCGEGVGTGARVLVTKAGVPVPVVKCIKLSRNLGSVKYPWLKKVEIKNNVPLQSQAAPCVGFQFHREWGGVTNPGPLTRGQYYVTVQLLINKRTVQKSVPFCVDKCTFNPNIVVNY